MELTSYQNPEIYDGNGNLVRSGAFGPNTPLTDPHGRGMYDYLVNNMENLNHGVGGAAQSASTATQKANEATAKANVAAEKATEASTKANQAAAAQTAAEAAKAAAEQARDQAAGITTPDGLAARVVALEDLGLSVVDGMLCVTYEA